MHINKKRIFISVSLIVLSAVLIIFPKKASLGAQIGMTNCLNVIIPSLFPFMVVTVFLTESGYYQKLFYLPSCIISRITGLNKQVCSLFIIGMLGGYQSAAKSVSLMCEKKLMSCQAASVLLCFCTNAGPAFLISAIGSGMFLSTNLGVIFYISSVLSSFTLMFFHTSKLPKEDLFAIKSRPENLSVCFVNSVKESCKSISIMCSFIVLFSVYINLLPDFSNNMMRTKGIVYGIFEVTSGCAVLSAETSLFSALSASAICGFGGLCVIFQVIAFCSASKINIKPFLLSRILHALLSSGYTFILLLAIPIQTKQSFISNVSSALPDVVSAPLPALMLLICCVSFPIYLTRQKNL